MTAQTLESVIINSGENPNHTIIWLHGLGADGHDFEPVVPELKLPTSLPVKFIFPHAPVRPITLNAGMAMRGWYDLKSLELDRSKQDPDGVRESSDQILELIQTEIEHGTPAENIILAGFSQGGAIALFTALTGPIKLAGVMGLSTYLPLAPEDLMSIKSDYQSLPIFMGHGDFDDIVQIKYAEMSRDLMKSQGFNPEWHTYSVAHGITPQEIQDISSWIQTVF